MDFMQERKILAKWRHHTPTTARVNNVAIMDALIKDQQINEEQLILANKCRLYLRVTMLSDICSGSGTKIIEGFLKGNRRAKEEVHRYPAQGRPTTNDWNTWEELIETRFLHNT